jgi:radical SAM superfamily enzyme YgiQ (UPF0313 family)
MLADDTYNDTTDKVRTLYEQVFSKLPFKPDLTAYLRLDLLHRFPEQEEMLVGSGLRSALFGLETNNDASARAIGKGMPFAKQVAYMHKLKTTTFSDTLISSGFILGLPYDTRESIQQLREFLLSTDNPVEDWIVRPLALNPVNTAHKRKFYSEFDLDHEKYGYEYLGTEGGDYAAVFRQRWRLKSADLTSDECLKLADEMMNECNDLPNFKYGSGGYCRMRTIIPAHEVRSKSRKQLHTEYDIPALERARVLDYYNRLLQL